MHFKDWVFANRLNKCGREVPLGKDDQAYFVQRAAEEMAAAERASTPAAASAHRELSLRYSLKLILPDPAFADDDSRPIGLPKAAPSRAAAAEPARRRPAKRKRA